MLFVKFFLFVSILINLLVAFFVLLKNPRKLSNWMYFGMIFSVVLWAVGLLIELVFIDKINLFVNSKFIFISATLIPLFIILFILSFVEYKITLKKILILLTPVIIILIILVKWGVVKDCIVYDSFRANFYNDFYKIFSLYFLIYSVIILVLLWKMYRGTKGLKKIQSKYIVVGILLPYICGAFTNLIAKVFDAYILDYASQFLQMLAYIGPVFSIFMSLIIAYAITRYRLFGIKFVIRKATTYILFLIIILALYTFLILIGQQILIENYNFNRTIVTIITVLIIALSFEPIRILVFKVINNLLSSRTEKKLEQIKKQAENVSLKIEATEKSYDELESIIVKLTKDYLNFISIQDVTLIIADAETKAFECIYPKEKRFKIKQSDLIYKYLCDNSEILIREEVPYLLEKKKDKDLNKIYKDMCRWDFEVAVPIGEGDNILAILFLGSKMNEEVYSIEDIKALKEFNKTAQPLLFNVVLYKQAVDRVI